MKKNRFSLFTAISALLAGFPAAVSAETLLLSDTFDTEASFAASPNADQLGMLAPATYTVDSPFATGGARRGIDALGTLEVGFNAATGTRVFTNADLAFAANTLNSPIRIRFTINAANTDWLGFVIGTASAWADAAGTTTEFSALFRADGSGNRWVNGAGAATATDPSNAITVELRNTAGTGSAFNGTGSVLQLWRGTTSLGIFTLDQLTSSNSRFAFTTWNGNGGAGGTIDQFEIAATVDSTPNRWSGSTDGNWDQTTANFTGGSFAAIKAGGATSVLFGDVDGALNPVTNSTINIADVGVDIAEVIFDANTVAYSLASNDTVGIKGSSQLIKSGTGTLTVGNVNTYTGPTTITGGSLVLSGGADRLPVGTVLTLTSPGVLRLNGNSQTLGGISSNGRVVNGNSTPATLTINSNTDQTFSGVFGGTGTDENLLTLAKDGTGMLTLNAASSYTGGTVIEEGTLQVNFEHTAPALTNALGSLLSSNVVTIRNGGILTGTVNNWLTNTNVTSGGANGLSLVIESGGLLRGATGRVTGLGNVTLSGGKIEVTSGLGAFNWNASFTLGGDITVSGSTPSEIVTATGANTNAAIYLANGSNGTGGTRTFTVNDVTDDSQADLLVGARIARGTVVKQGSGTVQLVAGVTGTEPPASWQVANGQWAIAAGGSYTCLVNNTGSNSVTEATGGTGTAVLNGTLVIDTTAVTRTTGTQWTLIDVPNLDATFDATSFNIPGFTQQQDGLTWTKSDTVGSWSFSETTGVLTLTVGGDYGTWGSQFGLGAGSEAGDLDGDGLSNFQEYAFGLLPNDASSANPVVAPLSASSGTFQYTRRATPASSGMTYRVWTSTDLTNWTEDTGATEGTITTSGGIETVPVTLSPSLLNNSKLFVRVQATRP